MKPLLLATLLTITTAVTAEPTTLVEGCAGLGNVGEELIRARDSGERARTFIDRLSRQDDAFTKKVGMAMVYDAYSAASADVTPEEFGDRWFMGCIQAAGGLSI